MTDSLYGCEWISELCGCRVSVQQDPGADGLGRDSQGSSLSSDCVGMAKHGRAAAFHEQCGLSERVLSMACDAGFKAVIGIADTY